MPETAIVEIKGGFKVPSDTHLGKWQQETQELDHDHFLPPLVCQKLSEGDFIIDCGAFNGDHAVAYSRTVGASGMVLAVEAGSMAFECLKHNITLFHEKNTFAVQACLSEVCGEIVDHNPDDNLGASVCKAVAKEDMKVGEKYLQTLTIDYLAGEAKRKVNFIKIDCEGWETKILIGASKTLKNDRPSMLIEINEGALKNQGSNADEIYEILDFHGYSWEIAQPECVITDPQFDVICKPKWRLGDVVRV